MELLKVIRGNSLPFGLQILALLVGLNVALADGSSTAFSTPRFTLYFDGSQNADNERALFVRDIAERSLTILNSTADEYSNVFQFRPESKVVLRFLTPREFRRQTGAPEWTSAMFYRGEISIPFSASRGMNPIELQRALRHEYVHAVIAEISDFKAPAWLDEGVAQLLEGQVNPLLGPALRRWINENDAMPLEWLQNGFTTLKAEMVPAAYAQSLFATRQIVSTLGYGPIVKYLQALRVGETEAKAFEKSFGMNQSDFESRLTEKIRIWAMSEEAHP